MRFYEINVNAVIKARSQREAIATLVEHEGIDYSQIKTEVLRVDVDAARVTAAEAKLMIAGE